MSGFEFNKFAGAVLFTLLVVVGASVLTEHIYRPPEHGKDGEGPAAGQGQAEEQAAASAEASASSGPPVEATAAPPPEAASLAALLANAQAAAGEKAAKKCSSCHNFEKGAGAKVGPDLWDVVGRPVASAQGFAYSDALKGLGGEWSFERLFAFIADPKAYAPGTKMSFAGVKSAPERADILAYLRTRSDAPAALPAAPAPESASESGQ